MKISPYNYTNMGAERRESTEKTYVLYTHQHSYLIQLKSCYPVVFWLWYVRFRGLKRQCHQTEETFERGERLWIFGLAGPPASNRSRKSCASASSCRVSEERRRTYRSAEASLTHLWRKAKVSLWSTYRRSPCISKHFQPTLHHLLQPTPSPPWKLRSNALLFLNHHPYICTHY